MAWFLTVWLLGVALFDYAVCYPDGPPVNANNPDLCSDMEPTGHNVQPQTEGYPFEIVVAAQCYKPGIDIPVFVRVNTTDNGEPYHEGLFVMARDYATQTINREQNVGTFDVKEDPQLKTLACFDKADSAVGQSTGDHMDCKTFYWRAPDSFTNDIVFHGTIVRNLERYWKDVKSPVLKYDANCSHDVTAVTCNVIAEESSEETEGGEGIIDGSDVIRLAVVTLLTSFMAVLVFSA